MDFTNPTSDIYESNNPLYNRNFQDNFVKGSKTHIKNLPNHTLVQLKNQNSLKSELQSLKKISVQFGSSLAIERQIQRSIASSNTRNSGIPTSDHAYDLITGNYDKLDFTDYLGRDKPYDVDESVFYKIDSC